MDKLEEQQNFDSLVARGTIVAKAVATQGEFAKELGVSQKTVFAWLGSELPGRFIALYILTGHFCVDLSWLITGEELDRVKLETQCSRDELRLLLRLRQELFSGIKGY